MYYYNIFYWIFVLFSFNNKASFISGIKFCGFPCFIFPIQFFIILMQFFNLLILLLSQPSAGLSYSLGLPHLKFLLSYLYGTFQKWKTFIFSCKKFKQRLQKTDSVGFAENHVDLQSAPSVMSPQKKCLLTGHLLPLICHLTF